MYEPYKDPREMMEDEIRFDITMREYDNDHPIFAQWSLETIERNDKIPDFVIWNRGNYTDGSSFVGVTSDDLKVQMFVNPEHLNIEGLTNLPLPKISSAHNNNGVYFELANGISVSMMFDRGNYCANRFQTLEFHNSSDVEIGIVLENYPEAGHFKFLRKKDWSDEVLGWQSIESALQLACMIAAYPTWEEFLNENPEWEISSLYDS